MKTFPNNLKFKYTWRKYQQRVLDELQDHLTDKHLHIIAPPGSGKTVLGLEVALRINKPTLILAPTLAIRNQWVQRFCELFLQSDETPEWISRDIRIPKFMTVVTYQGIHMACSDQAMDEEDLDEEEEIENIERPTAKSINKNLEAIVAGLKSQGVETIVVDEAHHLKNEWWQTLTKIKEQLNPFIVGLTATPPYDVTGNEWQRYIDLNGPVDSEISVPELIIENNLCPHQDYVFFTLPTETESKSIVAFRENVEALFQEYKNDEVIIEAISGHPLWLNPADQLEWIYGNLPCYSAVLIFLHANGIKVPKPHLEIIGDKNAEIPPLDLEWLSVLFDFYLYKEKDHFSAYEVHRKDLEKRLRRCGALEGRQINFLHNKKLTGVLTSSMSKLEGIREIGDFEFQALGKDLRMVILADFIRKEYFVNASENNMPLYKMGVMPIFEKLRRENRNRKKIGVLTGSMVIIPLSALQSFQTKAAKLGLFQIATSPVPYDRDYMLIQQSEQLKHHIVQLVTQVFQEGEIEILVGTKSLLGEGWDAPAINALILASFVGSFVLSNQMRGRAIRTQQGNPGKTGNIWHLVCVDPTIPAGGDDLELLKRRFRSFVGVSFKKEGGIENGIGRLDLPHFIGYKEAVDATNARNLSLAADRESLKHRWEKALESGQTLVEEIKIPFPRDKHYKTLKSTYYNKTIANVFATLASGLVGFGLKSVEGMARVSRHMKNPQDLYYILGVIGVLGVVIFGRYTYKTARLYFKYRDIAKDVQHIGDALLHSLIKAGLVHTDSAQLEVRASVDAFGGVYCHMEGGSTFERSTFINALQEVISRVDNPRYVVIRKSLFMNLFKQKDFHAVPEILGRNKTLAEFFSSQWKKWVGDCELVFTRNIAGRKMLLKARTHALAAQIEGEVEHVNKWR